jgi:hypothetical protein
VSYVLGFAALIVFIAALFGRMLLCIFFGHAWPPDHGWYKICDRCGKIRGPGEKA